MSAEPVKIGNLLMGGEHPVRIQSMTSLPTMDTMACVEQCIRIIDAGGELVRLTARNIKEAENLQNIRTELRKRGYHAPLSADVHFNPEIAETAARIVEKVRINPGNFALRNVREKLLSLLEICRQHQTALRIGVNHGSLSERIMEKYGDTPEGMVESAMEYLRICRDEGFSALVVSLKSSNTRVMIQANRMLTDSMKKEGMNYPLHLGVTEAGEGEDGRIRSAVGIGTLLAEGIGNTIRVSLTEEPEYEIPVARKLIESIKSLSAQPHSCQTLSFQRRKTIAVGEIGGGQVPVVIRSSGPGEETSIYISESLPAQEIPGGVRIHSLPSSGPMDIDDPSPVIIRASYDESDPETFMIRAACELGRYFVDGLADGIWLENTALPEETVLSAAFGILQASRARMSRTEYIACPSCGRTLFNIQETLARVKVATSHLKHLKIAVMGCIVNGVGEMADADYGYVGSAAGKITLYKGKNIMKKGITSEQAVEELVSLIKEQGDWRDP